jgi:uracil-DNA glycosylase family 4
MSDRPDPSRVARFVRQRQEMGTDEWVLDDLSSARALRLAERARAGSATREMDEAEEEVRAEADPVPSEVPASSFSLPDEYEALRDVALKCTRCRLASGRTQVVFSDGNPSARVMVVGEAPGANEDRTGLPFVGAAGKLLDLLLAAVDLSREETVYICNVIKCRPPGNRNPRPDEIEACAPFLRKQIELVRPEIILAVGTFAAQLLSGTQKPLGKLRGKVYAYEGIPLIVTYHPAALLRSPAWTRPTWSDLQLLRDVVDGGKGEQ